VRVGTSDEEKGAHCGIGGRGRFGETQKTFERLLAGFVFGSKLCSNSMKKKNRHMIAFQTPPFPRSQSRPEALLT
jgi:hypothetical protein